MRYKDIIIYLFMVVAIFTTILYNIFHISGCDYIACGLLAISVLSVSIEKGFFRLIKSFPVVIWLIWTIYAFINWKLVGLQSTENSLHFIIVRFCLPIGMMWMVYYEGCVNLKRTTYIIVATTSLYVLLGILLQDRGVAVGTDWEVRGGMELGNDLPLTACCLTFFATFGGLIWKWNKVYVYILLGIALSGILFTSTRKAIVGWGIIMLFYIFTQINRRNPRTWIRLLCILTLLFIGVYYILQYTVLGSRFAEVEDQGLDAIEDFYNVPPALRFLGDRALQYILGWELFLKKPITGIGLNNFMVLTDLPIPLHSEYMVQLSECGIIGTILFFSFMGGMIAIVIRAFHKYSKRVALLCLGALLCMFFIDLTAWTYQHVRYFAMYGLILAFCNPVFGRKKHRYRQRRGIRGVYQKRKEICKE